MILFTITSNRHVSPSTSNRLFHCLLRLMLDLVTVYTRALIGTFNVNWI